MINRIRGRLDYVNWKPRIYMVAKKAKPYCIQDGRIYFWPRMESKKCYRGKYFRQFYNLQR